MTSVPVPAATNPMRPVLPSRGVATVKSVLSGDTVLLLGRATNRGEKAPEVLFTFERVTAPRMASKANNNIDDPGAFASREWLRSTCIGKSVQFETRKQGATAGDRVYGLLFKNDEEGNQMNLAVESVRRGYATPKVFGDTSATPAAETTEEPVENDDPIHYERQLQAAFQEAKAASVGVHSPEPLVRTVKNAGEDFETLALVERAKKACDNETVKCVIEYIFDGSRYRCSITDPQLEESGLLYGSFTLILGGVSCPRVSRDPSFPSESFADDAKNFVELRLLHRELQISLHGTDKSGVCAVGTVHHPRGNIALELLKNGYGRVCDWSVRMMNPLEIPAFRIAENEAKRTNKNIWHDYSPPVISGASEIHGTVIEVLTGDTLSILPSGTAYDSEDKLKKISLASMRAPRIGNEKLGKPDEPYAYECKDRFRQLVIGRTAKVNVHYERDIPMGPNTTRRQFATISTGKREDIAEVLLSEGLAETQRHRDDDEKSPRYDELVAAEVTAKAAKKGIHSPNEYAKRTVVDLTEPKKAKAYSGSLMRAGLLKGVVDYVFNGSRFKIYVPSENCYISFALENLRCPQPSPIPGVISKGPVRNAEPFGDESRRHARLSVHQRTIEIQCRGITQGGVITGQLFVGSGAQRRDYSMELVSAGLATVDPRSIEYGNAPKILIDAMNVAEKNKTGLWSIEREVVQTVKPITKSKEQLATITLSEIRSGSHFFYHVVGDDALEAIDSSMKEFTESKGTTPAPCDTRIGKIVAAIFDDGTGKRWYRAKVLGKDRSKITVLFLDYGNVSKLSSNYLRPLDVPNLGVDKIKPVAKEAFLALIRTPPITDDDGIDAARYFQSVAWGKNLTAKIHCDIDSKRYITLYDPEDSSGSSINTHLIEDGLGRLAKKQDIEHMKNRMADSTKINDLVTDLMEKEESARKGRKGMWRYGDIGDDEDEDYP